MSNTLEMDNAGDRQRGTRTARVMDAIRSRVAGRSLSPGDRLPSIRRCATAMNVSPSTVVEAYERLTAEGLIHPRRGSGFYVSATALPPLSVAEIEPVHDRAVDPFWVSRQSLDADAETLKPGCGWLPASWMPVDALRRAFRGIARGAPDLMTDYGSSRGSPRLRRLMAARLAGLGVDAAADQVLLTSSGTQAIDLVCRLFLRPGDTVLVDDPCYFNFLALLRAHQVRIASVPYTPAGPDIGRFESVLAAERPRLYLTNSALHNPTGATMSLRTAHRLLTAAAEHDLTIVEDDIFAEFEPEPSPRLAALDGLERVIHVGSFSKTLSSSVRCGYIAARRDWIDDLVDLQVATGFGGPSPFATEAIAQTLTGGQYRKHIAELHRRLDHARSETADRLAALGIEPWLMPRGGFYLWCHLPDGLDSAEMARKALEKKVVLAPGNVFSPSQTAAGFMRFNAAQCGDPQFIDVLKRAMGT